VHVLLHVDVECKEEHVCVSLEMLVACRVGLRMKLCRNQDRAVDQSSTQKWELSELGVHALPHAVVEPRQEVEHVHLVILVEVAALVQHVQPIVWNGVELVSVLMRNTSITWRKTVRVLAK